MDHYSWADVGDPSIPDGVHGTGEEELFTLEGATMQGHHWRNLQADNALDDQKIKVWIGSLVAPTPHW